MSDLPHIVPYVILYSVFTIIIATVISKVINQNDFAAGIGGTLVGAGGLGLFYGIYKYDLLMITTCIFMILTGSMYIVDYTDRKGSNSSSNTRAYTICFVVFFCAMFRVVLELLSDRIRPFALMITATIGIATFVLGTYFAVDGV
jgi:hypothetical protein